MIGRRRIRDTHQRAEADTEGVVDGVQHALRSGLPAGRRQLGQHKHPSNGQRKAPADQHKHQSDGQRKAPAYQHRHPSDGQEGTSGPMASACGLAVTKEERPLVSGAATRRLSA
eukprot:2016815-Pyramimonas_sp.AAC.1